MSPDDYCTVWRGGLEIFLIGPSNLLVPNNSPEGDSRSVLLAIHSAVRYIIILVLFISLAVQYIIVPVL